ncbi:STAS domain-containing protein [Cellulomonas sp. 179-A 4D5 NHS]|uniref:STAS domain-containing protein n=1 Tax=Cellulomonas sp. 179-A 4D5 NHS TaxID=3142378 RepID=UPI00399FFBFE
MRDDEAPIGMVQVAVGPDAVLVTLTGEIDTELAEDLDDAARMVRELGLPVMVDALGVTFIDSNGARFMSRCFIYGPLTVAASPAARFLLLVLGMDEVLTGSH